MNSSFKAKAEALIAEITAAFDGVSREDGISLHEAAGLDNYEYSPEERAVNRAKDTDAKWQDVPDGWIAQMGLGDVALNYFDPNGFRYYIPVYMIWMLKVRAGWSDGSQTMTEDSIESTFIGYKNERQKARFALFTVKQSKAIAHFLKFWADDTEQFMAEHNFDYDPESDPINQALGYYWGQFL